MARDRTGDEIDSGVGSARKTSSDFPSSKWRCAWLTNSKRCYLPGGISPDDGQSARRYCGWHYNALSVPAIVDDYREFERWLLRWSQYCTLQNHHPSAEIWQALRGEAAIRSAPSGCGHPSCRHPAGKPKGAPGLRPSIARASVQEEMQTLEDPVVAQNRPLALTPDAAMKRAQVLGALFLQCGEKLGEFASLALRAGYSSVEIAASIRATHPDRASLAAVQMPLPANIESGMPWQ